MRRARRGGRPLTWPTALAALTLLATTAVQAQTTPEEVTWALEIEAPEPLRARIDAGDLTEALGALMENAMRHAHETVTASVRAEGGKVAIRVRDDGPGVPEADLTRLTQRGLSLDPESEGQGIGLALVAGVADAAGGSLRMRNARPGLEVLLTLDPAAR